MPASKTEGPRTASSYSPAASIADRAGERGRTDTQDDASRPEENSRRVGPPKDRSCPASWRRANGVAKNQSQFLRVQGPHRKTRRCPPRIVPGFAPPNPLATP